MHTNQPPRSRAYTNPSHHSHLLFLVLLTWFNCTWRSLLYMLHHPSERLHRVQQPPCEMWTKRVFLFSRFHSRGNRTAWFIGDSRLTRLTRLSVAHPAGSFSMRDAQQFGIVFHRGSRGQKQKAATDLERPKIRRIDMWYSEPLSWHTSLYLRFVQSQAMPLHQSLRYVSINERKFDITFVYNCEFNLTAVMSNLKTTECRLWKTVHTKNCILQ